MITEENRGKQQSEAASSFALSFFRQFLSSPKKARKPQVGRPSMKRVRVIAQTCPSAQSRAMKHSQVKANRLKAEQNRCLSSDENSAFQTSVPAIKSSAELDQYKSNLNISPSPDSDRNMNKLTANRPLQ